MPFVGEGGEDEAYYDGYYDENGEWVVNGEWNSSGMIYLVNYLII